MPGMPLGTALSWRCAWRHQYIPLWALPVVLLLGAWCCCFAHLQIPLAVPALWCPSMRATAGTYGTGTGATSPACTGPCVATPGTYCPPGATSALPLPCPRGRYSSSGGASVCTACPGGTAGPVTGMNTSACGGLCGPGSFSPPGSATCFVCSAGWYSNVSGVAVCSRCPAGTYGAVTGLTQSTCSGRCVPTPGRYVHVILTSLLSHVPPPVVVGVAPSLPLCLLPPSVVGRYCPSAAVVVDPVLCPAGSVSANGSLGACDPCPAGSFCPSVGATTVGGVCDPGTFSVSGSLVCSACPAGGPSGMHRCWLTAAAPCAWESRAWLGLGSC